MAMLPAHVLAQGSELPDFDETVQGWTASEGLMTLYRPEKGGQELRAAVPSGMVDQPFFMATSVSGGSDYAGWQWADLLVRFERLEDKLLLVELQTNNRVGDEQDPLHEVVDRTYANRLLASIDIIAEGGPGLLIDLGSLVKSDYSTFFGSYFALDSMTARFTATKAFPQNLEIGVQMPDYSDGTFMTLHYSISSLPELSDYTPRQADDRIGYFLTAIRDYSAGDPRQGRMLRLVNRWKLEKADESLELSPPKQPIVFYVEKSVPYAYRQAVHAGILEWNKA
ncbi:DUF5117 domain-containing protein, partial [Planctomycetota bacterium]|nr:DUF5117 domain-containing protein [Planctomycetota bacterium]